MAVLALIGAGTRWATIFSGTAVPGLLFVFGVMYSEALPPRFAERVWAAEEAGNLGIHELIWGQQDYEKLFLLWELAG